MKFIATLWTSCQVDSGQFHEPLGEALFWLRYPVPRDLGTLARLYTGITIDKNDPFRLRYAELLDRPWDQADPGFFSYAIKDSIATWKLYQTLSAIAAKIAKPFDGDFFPGYRKAWGLLTESLQVRGAIALSQIERNGIALDQTQVESTKAKLSAQIETLIESLQQLPETAGLFKRSKCGSLIRTGGSRFGNDQAKRTGQCRQS